MPLVRDVVTQDKQHSHDDEWKIDDGNNAQRHAHGMIHAVIV